MLIETYQKNKHYVTKKYSVSQQLNKIYFFDITLDIQMLKVS